MSTNKHAIIRYQALDKCFRNTGRRYYMDDLVEACNHALYEFSGITDGVKKRQVFDDITFMQSDQGWSIPLKKTKEGRKVFYKYSNPNFSINNEPLNEAEANQLKEALLTLNRFKGMPQFEWVDEMITRLESSFDLVHSENQIIEFEQNPYLKGLEHISELYHAIAHKQVLEITYQGFKQIESSTFIFHPHYLKQYNNRWFLFGKNAEFDSVVNLALDRIIGFDKIQKQYLSSEINFDEYFEDVIGVSLPTDEEPIKITLNVNHKLWPYIKSKPLHGSQKIINQEEEHVLIQLELIPNYELESMILQYGDGLEVVEPQEYRDKIKVRIDFLNKKYN